MKRPPLVPAKNRWEENVYAPRQLTAQERKERQSKRMSEWKAARAQGKSKKVVEVQRLHITGGSKRGRRIVTPDIYLRPMMSAVREALFSLLVPADLLHEQTKALDLFSGSGAIGLECLSRGMGYATCVDFSPQCKETIEENAKTLKFSDKLQVVQAGVDQVLKDPQRFGIDISRKFDLVTVTPPYEEVVYKDLIANVANSPAVGEDTMVVIEYPVELGCLPQMVPDTHLVGVRNRRYGRTVLAIYINQPTGRIEYMPAFEEFINLKGSRR